MKNGILTFLLVAFAMVSTLAQPLLDRTGTASFYSEAPLEDIEAINEEVLGAIDLEKGTLAVSMFIKKFNFERSLMQEHFNENYLESDKYPKATFKGVIKDFAAINFTEAGSFEAQAEGEMEIHGVVRPLTAVVKFNVSPETLRVSTEFEVSVADHEIEIPKLVIKNIAEVVEVRASFNFKRQER
ncbi:MAG: YceI family protein [Reichenbachiella sp.]|uniref:YceI family protein n=2 Tax=Reichenbachiella sp. TaxID=2184521 RepID=UPI00326670A7